MHVLTPGLRLLGCDGCLSTCCFSGRWTTMGMTSRAWPPPATSPRSLLVADPSSQGTCVSVEKCAPQPS
eukprot:scaffold62_cov256-Pinguiococcus_pyrenoidosus.AAC.20